MSEKAISIGMYFVASGIYVVIGQSLPVEGSRYVTDLLTKTFEEHFGATWAFQPDPIAAARLMSMTCPTLPRRWKWRPRPVR